MGSRCPRQGGEHEGEGPGEAVTRGGGDSMAWHPGCQAQVRHYPRRPAHCPAACMQLPGTAPPQKCGPAWADRASPWQALTPGGSHQVGGGHHDAQEGAALLWLVVHHRLLLLHVHPQHVPAVVLLAVAPRQQHLHKGRGRGTGMGKRRGGEESAGAP